MKTRYFRNQAERRSCASALALELITHDELAVVSTDNTLSGPGAVSALYPDQCDKLPRDLMRVRDCFHDWVVDQAQLWLDQHFQDFVTQLENCLPGQIQIEGNRVIARNGEQVWRR